MYYENCLKKISIYKALLAVFIIFAVMISAMSSARADDQDYAVVRVKLSVGTPDKLSFFLDGNYTIEGTALERQQYTVKLEGANVGLYYGDDFIYRGNSIRLVQHEPTDGRNNFVYLYNSYQEAYLAYTGDIEFSIDAGKQCIQVINHIYTEDYLLGVVPYEMNDSWPVDALKAQAVAARNYVISKMGGTEYDVIDTAKNQVYKGYSASLTNTKTAVEETKGEVLTYGGGIVEMFYGASNGGWTEIPQHVWTQTNPLYPYHIIKQDPYDIMNAWSVQEALVLPKAGAEAGISYEYFDEGAMVPVEISEDPEAPVPVEIANAKKCLKESAMPQLNLLGYSALDSITSVNSVMTHTYQEKHGAKDYDNNDCVCFRYAQINMTVMAKAGEASEAVPVDVEFDIDMMALADDESPYYVFDRHPSLRLFTVEETDTEWRIWHRRNGHGIGISQRGAQQRAKSDDPLVRAYDNILEFYYPGAALAEMVYDRPALTAVTAPDHSNAVMAAGGVNVRVTPDTSQSPIGKLPKGARIEVIESYPAPSPSITWHKILFGGKYAYVAGNYNSDIYVQLDDPQPPAESCTVSFQVNGGSNVSPQTVQHGRSIPSAPVTARANYDFGGWYIDSGLTRPAAFPYIVTRDSTLYAKWTERAYNITYNLNGGSASNPASYTASSTTITLKNPTRSGYDFIGWSGTGISGLSMSVTIPAGSTGDRAYSANWRQQITSAYLRGIGLSAGSLSPSFSKARYSYKVYLGENQNSVTLTPIKEYDGASMTIAGKAVSSHAVSVANGKSTNVYVKVKYGRTTKTYKFTVTRAKSTNNNLASLTASAGTFDKAFNPAVTNYTLTLGENTKSVKIYDTVASSYARASFKSKAVSLKNGQSKMLKLTVKAQSGARKTYVITVKRAPSTNTNLTYLKTNSKSYPLTPSYSAGTAGYTVTLPVNKSSVKIYAKPAGYKAAAYMDGSKRSSMTVTLQAGQSRAVRVAVRAQSGDERTYTITVRRLISTDANLKSLKVSATISPAFSPGVTSYTVTLSANSRSLTLRASSSGYGSKVTIDGRRTTSKRISLQPGQSVTVRVVVTAQAGNTKEYVVTVRRP